MERNFEIKPIGVQYICDVCKKGEMTYTGKMILTDPYRFEHECNQCGVCVKFKEKYPLVRYVNN